MKEMRNGDSQAPEEVQKKNYRIHFEISSIASQAFQQPKGCSGSFEDDICKFKRVETLKEARDEWSIDKKKE